ncbi:type II toxin-antitoxin system RelE/ParE family toxin [Cupriavidus basilensis]|uniref:Type II toxin-antitoxin system RelE/ParE family toxin n=1 Tax=Cupriavidus basilensis TaxID=68895 RepID=A0A643FMP8_9BURK|nr:type II toxin-antitoxin system RelE/ParE family toxin [Cupriavidus basilensis]QOT82064.1 type II toxin-antitoxin system RelE/ParE family toxin [Cupriavidus basilensis]
MKSPAQRVFKTSWFSKTASKAGIDDAELCEAAQELMLSQGDDLGGGVWKKRLNKNRHRSIVLNKVGKRWIFTYLFAKKDRENISDKELEGFKKLSKDYAAASASQIAGLLGQGELLEICHDC